MLRFENKKSVFILLRYLQKMKGKPQPSEALLKKKEWSKILSKGVTNSFVNLENYPQGVYLLQMRLGDSVVSKKLVKQ